jgi:hypothetical protein
MVLYVWNQGFDCIFCDSNGLNKVPIFSAWKIVIQDAIPT